MPVEIRRLTKEDDEGGETVSFMFREMYDYMADIGLNLKLIEGGEFAWIKSIKNGLGKLNLVCIAEDGDEIIGFSAGNIRRTPAYSGQYKSEILSHLYVDPGKREQNAGRLLAVGLEAWFEEMNVDFIELEVIEQNKGAKAFWSRLGFHSDNIRMIKK